VDFDQLTGPEKAAILVLSLPEDRAREFFARMEDDEVEKILAAIARFEEIPPKIQEQVLEEFREAVGERNYGVAGGRDRALALLERSLSEDRAREIMVKLGRDEKRIDWTLRGFEPAFVAAVLRSEHPQTIALILSQIPAEHGAEVIHHLPEDLRPEVLLRLADLGTVTTEIVGELEEGVAELFGRRPGSPTRVGGHDVAAKLLNRVPKTDGQAILEGLESRNPELAGEIRKRMLTFNDLVNIDRKGFQALLREISTEDLVVALKLASEEMKEKVFSNVSSRAADQLREEGELLGPMRVADVEKVQQQIVDVARRLEEEGRLSINLGGGDEMV